MNPAALQRTVDRVVADLALGRIRSVAFVVPSDLSMTMPLYEVAIATARRGWRLGLEDVRYCFVTPEPEPLVSFGSAACAWASRRLEPEGITFIGSTYADVRRGVVLLDPQGESIEVDRVVSLRDLEASPARRARRRRGRRSTVKPIGVSATPRRALPRAALSGSSRRAS
jgi:hypothetical protein